MALFRWAHSHEIKDDSRRTYTIRDGLSSLAVRSVYEDRQGNVWIGISAAGFNRFQHGKFTIYSTKDGLPKERVQSMYEDRQGSLWLATQGGGLSQLRDGRFVTTYSKTEFLFSNFIPPFYEDREGNLWLGTSDDGLRRKDDRFAELRDRFGLSNQFVRVTLQDREGRFWIATDHLLIKYENELTAEEQTGQDERRRQLKSESLSRVVKEDLIDIRRILAAHPCP